MGCVASKADKEERVRISEDRKRLMKQLIRCRKEFADAQLGYLRSLINTGLTLRQFTESQSLEPEETASGVGFPPSPPPPPPPFSPDLRNPAEKPSGARSGNVDVRDDDKETSSSPLHSSSWEYWDLFGSASREHAEHSDDDEEEGIMENWADTKDDFAEDDKKKHKEVMEEDQEEVFTEDQVDLLPSGCQINQLDDNSSTSSWHTKDNEDAAMIVWRAKKSLAAIIKNLDEYFLKASATLRDVAVLIDVEMKGNSLHHSLNENKGKKSNSAKVFGALSWNWSSRSFRYTKEKGDLDGEIEPCKPGAHRLTLEKLYLEEQTLYKNIKEEEAAKVEYVRKSSLLQRLEEGKDRTNFEKTRTAVESLESRILSLQESIEQSSSNILILINEELQPQLIALASGMAHMWRMMRKCHQIQNHISQQLNHLTDESSIGQNTEYLLLAACQLRTEVSSWYHNFCGLAKFQREYIRTLCEWTKLTKGIHDTDGPWSKSSSVLHQMMEKWLQTLDKLPETMVSEAINSLLSAISNILLQLQDEQNTRRKCEKLTRRLERELSVLSEVEMKFAGNDSITPNGKHPLILRRTKVEAQRKSVDDENAKYTSCVKATRAMILCNLKTNLPKTFEALVAYSRIYAQSFDDILNNATE